MSSPQPQPLTPAITAIAALQNAYTGWQDFKQTSAQFTPSPHNVPNDANHASNPAPPSAALAFIQSCPYIELADIPEHERNCPVCFAPYHPLSALGKPPHAKKEENIIIVQRMPCGHYMCNSCLYKWLDPLDERSNNTCPYDRRVLFPKLLPGTEGLQQRVDLIDWIYSIRGQPPAGDERDRTSELKASLVEGRLGEAIRESEVHLGLMQFTITNAWKIGNAVLFAYLQELTQELLQFEHRLTEIENIANPLGEKMPLSTFRVRLQYLVEEVAGMKGNVYELLGAWN